MIIELENPFSRLKSYNCFACNPEHPFGLRLKFFYDDEKEEIFSPICMDQLFAGFPGILHGGIQATILDETAFWGIWAKHKKSGFTFDLTIRYRKKCPVSHEIEARGKIGDMNRRMIDAQIYLWDPKSSLVYTEGSFRYFLPDIDPRQETSSDANE
jgi:acyl-coenzyme A thioesterase PaaI-like protein